jgi:phosphoadenosine phosphosulfate reductase
MRAVEKLLATKRLLTHLSRDFAPVALFQTFSVEDMVLADLIYADLVHQEYASIKMFTIDTGKLPDESHRLIEQIRQRYGDVIKIYYPSTAELEQFDARFGFRGNDKDRNNDVRLLQPLRRALSQSNAWITSSDALNDNVSSSSWISWDNHHQIPRFNPLSRWTKDEIWSYSKHHNLPVHGHLQSDQIRTRNLETGLWWWQTDISIAREARQNIA